MSSAPQIYLTSPVITPQEDIDARAAQLGTVLAAAPVAALRLRFAAQDERSLIKRVKPLVGVVQTAGAAAILEIVTLPAGPDGDPQAMPDLATIAVRAGTDGVHLDDPARVPEMIARFDGQKAVGLANPRNRHEAMEAGEAGVDYLAFGEPRRDGSLPDPERAREMAAWWAEIFETPCAIFAPDRAAIASAIRTGAEFISLGDAVFADPGGAPQALAACAETITSAWQQSGMQAQ